jgi:hypothetical protein
MKVESELRVIICIQNPIQTQTSKHGKVMFFVLHRKIQLSNKLGYKLEIEG